MDNKKNNHSDTDSDTADLNIAKLGYFGAVLATIGDGIAAVAAGLAVQQLEKTSKDEDQDQAELMKQVERMQKQIDQLTYKIEKMERKKR